MDCMGSGRERVKYMFGAMFKGATFFDIFLWNVALAAVWCVVAFIACIKLPSTFFDFEKKRYQAMKWEKNGRWYKDHLHIQQWKDRLPQHIAKDGFFQNPFDQYVAGLFG